MKEQDLKRDLLVERQKVKIPKKAIFHAIDEGIQQAKPDISKRFSIQIVAAVVLVGIIGTGISGVADGLFAKEEHPMEVVRFYDGMSISPEKNDRAKAFVMEKGIGYWANGEKSVEADPKEEDILIEPGIYDVSLSEGEIGEAIGRGVLLPGETYSGYFFGEGNYGEVVWGDASLQFTPAVFEPLEKIGEQYVLKNKFGEFEVGAAIEPGIYQVDVEDASAFSMGWSVSVFTEHTMKNGDTFSDGATFSQKEFGGRVIELRVGALLRIARKYQSEDKAETASLSGNYEGVPPQVKITMKLIEEE